MVTIHQIDNATLADWAKDAGYETAARRREFCKLLDNEIITFNIFLSASAPDIRRQVASVADAIGNLLAALFAMDDATANRLAVRFDLYSSRQAMISFCGLVERMGRVSESLSVASAEAMPGPVTERGARATDLEDLATGLAAIYEAGRPQQFELGDALPKLSPRYASKPHDWLSEILHVIVPDIGPNEIDKSAKKALTAIRNARAEKSADK